MKKFQIGNIVVINKNFPNFLLCGKIGTVISVEDSLFDYKVVLHNEIAMTTDYIAFYENEISSVADPNEILLGLI